METQSVVARVVLPLDLVLSQNVFLDLNGQMAFWSGFAQIQLPGIPLSGEVWVISIHIQYLSQTQIS